MENKPGAIFIVDICREQNAVKEATRLGIPLVAVVDTNADPDPIQYVIPGNDDAVRGVKMIADAFAKVIKEANDEYSRIASERMRQKEAEQANQDAQERANRKVRKDAVADGADTAKLTETRKRAAKAAKDAVDAKAASVETSPVEAAPAEEAPAVEAAAAE
jgi:small subunit ribosomal protein S2